MTPGRFHAETGATITVPKGPGIVIPLRDLDGNLATESYLPVGDTAFDRQVSNVTFAGSAAQRPTSLTVDLVRKGDDRTARCTRVIPPSGTYADVFPAQEYVNDDDGLFHVHISHNGTQNVYVGKVVVKGINPRASEIHELGGYNRWSDGGIR